MFPDFVKVGESFCKYLLETVKKTDQVEVFDWVARYTIDVIGTCGFGFECNSLENPKAEFLNKGRLIFSKRKPHILVELLVNRYREQAKKLGLKIFPTEVSTFFMQVVKETIQYREENNVTRNDFMDLLIKMKNQETEEEAGSLTLHVIAAQAATLLSAGGWNS